MSTSPLARDASLLSATPRGSTAKLRASSRLVLVQAKYQIDHSPRSSPSLVSPSWFESFSCLALPIPLPRPFREMQWQRGSGDFFRVQKWFIWVHDESGTRLKLGWAGLQPFGGRGGQGSSLVGQSSRSIRNAPTSTPPSSRCIPLLYGEQPRRFNLNLIITNAFSRTVLASLVKCFPNAFQA